MVGRNGLFSGYKSQRTKGQGKRGAELTREREKQTKQRGKQNKPGTNPVRRETEKKKQRRELEQKKRGGGTGQSEQKEGNRELNLALV
jgi:hypothetical protein